jgi:hypothetical protein
MYTDGNNKTNKSDVVKKPGGWYLRHPNGQEELIHTLKDIGNAAAVVASVTNHADGTYSAPTSLSFTVEFNEAVTVTTTGGTPYLEVYTEAGDAYQIPYVSGSGTTDLVFTGDVTGMADGDLVVVEEIQLNGGTILDAAGNWSDDDFPADYVQPTIVMSTAVIDTVTNETDGTYANTDDLTFEVEYSEAVTLNGVAGVFLEVEDAAETVIQIPLASGDGTTTLTFTGPATDAVDGELTVLTVLAMGAATTLEDAAGNLADLNFPADYVQPAIVMETV